MVTLISSRPVGWGCRIHWLHLCSGVTLPHTRTHTHDEATCWPWVATCNAWGQNSRVWAVGDLATRWVVGEAWSDQLSGYVCLLLDLCKNLNEDDGCRVNYAVERLVALFFFFFFCTLGKELSWEGKPRDKIKLSNTSMSILNV